MELLVGSAALSLSLPEGLDGGEGGSEETPLVGAARRVAGRLRGDAERWLAAQPTGEVLLRRTANSPEAKHRIR